MEENRIVIEFENSDTPEEAAAARKQREQFDQNSAWLQGEIPGKFQGHMTNYWRDWNYVICLWNSLSERWSINTQGCAHDLRSDFAGRTHGANSRNKRRTAVGLL